MTFPAVASHGTAAAEYDFSLKEISMHSVTSTPV